jgi:hypothetical protein
MTVAEPSMTTRASSRGTDTVTGGQVNEQVSAYVDVDRSDSQADRTGSMPLIAKAELSRVAR